MSKTRYLMSTLAVCALSLVVACGAPPNSGEKEWGDSSGSEQSNAAPTPELTPTEVTVEAPQAASAQSSGDYLNFRDGELTSVIPITDDIRNSLQDSNPARTILQLPRMPKANDWIALEKTIKVDDPNATYTLDGLVENEWYRANSGRKILIFKILINGVETYQVDLSMDAAPIKVKIADIKPVDSSVSVKFVLTCLHDNEKESWIEASRVGLLDWTLTKN